MNAETMTDKPAPCPFCGSSAYVESESCGYRVVCDNKECATQGPWPTDCTEAEALTAWNARTVQAELVEALKWYADQFCEFGQSNEGCGKYHDDVCAGCKARSAITRATGAAS